VADDPPRSAICSQRWTKEITALSKLRGKRSERKPQLVRLGHREIETLGLSPGFWSDLYHRSMTVYWPVFFGSAAALFVALILYSLGHEPIANAAENGPLAYFYFSIETLATVGYGDMHPQSNYGHLNRDDRNLHRNEFSCGDDGADFRPLLAPAPPFRVRQ
jgi:Ion channel